MNKPLPPGDGHGSLVLRRLDVESRWRVLKPTHKAPHLCSNFVAPHAAEHVPSFPIEQGTLLFSAHLGVDRVDINISLDVIIQHVT